MNTWWLLAPIAVLLAAALVHAARPRDDGGRMPPPAPLWRRAAPVALALALGLGGYALFGRPALPARPASPITSDPLAMPEMEAARARLLRNEGDIGAWLTMADGLSRAGKTEQAVGAMTVATRYFPRSADLWVGLGNALVLHADGQVTPAARLAFNRASLADPTHPAPRYFLGLAWMQAGRPREARAAWEALLEQSPPGAPWIGDVRRRIAATRVMETMGVGGS